MPTIKLSVYRLSDPGGALKTVVNDGCTQHPELLGVAGADAVLFMPQDTSRTPSWLAEAAQHYANVPARTASTVRGAFIVRTAIGLFAVCIGTAAHSLLKSELVERGWGTRIALNLLYDSTGAIQNQGRSLRSERKSTLVKGTSTAVQSGRSMSLDTLGFDATQEILRGVAVSDVKRKGWSPTVSAADGVSLGWKGGLDSLALLCDDLESLSSLTHYQKHFAFVDSTKIVRSATVLAGVWDAVAAEIVAGNIGELGLNPPGQLDFGGTSFGVLGLGGASPRGGHALLSPTVADYRALLVKHGKLAGFGRAELAKHKIRAFDGEEDEKVTGSVKRWLEGSVASGGVDYVLSEGDVYTIEPSYLSELDMYVDGVGHDAAVRLGLPNIGTIPTRLKKWTQKSTGKAKQAHVRDERAYNMEVSKAADRLCMDAKNVITVPKRTEPIELCDVLVASPFEFLHVKIGTASSKLSHLFNQALVSSELLIDSNEFRKAARKKIKGVAGGAVAAPFTAVIPTAISTGAKHRVTIVIVASGWTDGSGNLLVPSAALPFFSKISLRTAIKRLKERGFQVELARVS